MKSRITSVLFLSLILSLFTACSDQPTSPDGPPGGQDTPNDSSSICGSTTAAPARCKEDPQNYKFSRATYVNKMKFPSEETYEGKANSFGAMMSNKQVTDVLDINGELEKSIDKGNLNLIIEFDGWGTAANAEPTTGSMVLVWTTQAQPTEGGDVTIDQKTRLKGTFSKGFFKNATFTKKSDGKYTVSTKKGRFELPISSGSIKLNAVLLEAEFSGTVVADGEGAKIESGVLSGFLTKKSVLDGLIESEKACMPGCIKKVEPNGKCTVADSNAGCNEDCKNLYKTCQFQGALGAAFREQNGTAGAAAIKISGVPVKITGIQ